MTAPRARFLLALLGLPLLAAGCSDTQAPAAAGERLDAGAGDLGADPAEVDPIEDAQGPARDSGAAADATPADTGAGADLGGAAPDQGAADLAAADACVPAPEICDGQDNDCDGETDEQIPLGPCSTICGQGKLHCDDGISSCDASQPTDEVCDGVDNDCNGAIDDGLAACCWPLDATRACGEALGLCEPGLQTCHAADGWGPCQGGQGPRDEACNGEDDDCDGVVDDVAAEGQPCGSSVGQCQQGLYHCANGVEDCAGERKAYPEVCDGLDDDCDGTTDEGNPGGGGPCGSAIGLCQPGTEACVDGSLHCVGGVPPQQERCNLADDDCDGETDEGALADASQPCDTGLPGVCGAGLTACHQGNLSCAEQQQALLVELCNGVDDTCDGSTDEGLGLGDPCWNGVGACRSQGVQVCAADRLGVQCTAQAGPPGTELCGNGVDDDCDGEIDEGFLLGAQCFVGQGACVREGKVACAADGRGTVCNGTPGDPGVELCGNEVDDDCDGQTDEELAGCGADECGPGFLDHACTNPDRFCVQWPNAGNHYHCTLPCDHQADCPDGFGCTVNFTFGGHPAGYTNGFGLCLPYGAQATKGIGEGCASNADCTTNNCYNGFCRELCSSDGWQDADHDFCPAEQVCKEVNLVNGGHAHYCVGGVADGSPPCQTHFDCNPADGNTYACTILGQNGSALVLGCAENAATDPWTCDLLGWSCPNWDNLGGFCNSDGDCFRGWCLSFPTGTRCSDMCVGDDDCGGAGNVCTLGTLTYLNLFNQHFAETAVRVCSNPDW